MRWKQGRRSENIEDRRSGRMAGVPGGAGGVAVGGLGLLLMVVVSVLMGQDPGQIISMVEQSGAGLPADEAVAPAGPTVYDEAADFVSVVLADTEDVWLQEFERRGQRYEPPTLVLFTDVVESACGVMQATTGPFYCPGDSQAYLDLGFLRELARLGAKGDFAVAYVIAHEIGHHVQNLLGTSAEVNDLQRRVSQADANALSVLVELQADCYAGVWGNHSKVELDQGDIEEGLNAAAAVGDDRLLEAAGRRVQREAFTHGSSAERVSWFRLGIEQGLMESCDTFKEAGMR
jgi:predicted metalloprotease